MLERREREQLDDRPFQFADVASNVFSDEAKDLLRHRRLEVIELRLLTEDRDAMLEVRELDVRHHPPLEAADETRLETGNLRGRSVTREDDLAPRFVERVEGVRSEERRVGKGRRSRWWPDPEKA